MTYISSAPCSHGVSSSRFFREDTCREKARFSSHSTGTREANWSRVPGNIRHHIGTSCAPRSSSTPRRDWPTTRSPLASTRRARSSRSGASASSSNASPGWRNSPGVDGPPAFPPRVVIAVKALACELPCDGGLPLSRYSIPELKREVLRRGLVASIGETTLWRWLSSDAIRPWRHRSWIFPRDPEFLKKASPVLDLYEGLWRGKPLGPNEFVLSADEKTSIQARVRKHPTLPPCEHRPAYVEHEYERGGALNYLAASDVHRAHIFGRCGPTSGMASFC